MTEDDGLETVHPKLEGAVFVPALPEAVADEIEREMLAYGRAMVRYHGDGATELIPMAEVVPDYATLINGNRAT